MVTIDFQAYIHSRDFTELFIPGLFIVRGGGCLLLEGILHFKISSV